MKFSFLASVEHGDNSASGWVRSEFVSSEVYYGDWRLKYVLVPGTIVSYVVS